MRQADSGRKRRRSGPVWDMLARSPELAGHAALYTWAAHQFQSGPVLDLGSEYGVGCQLLAGANPRLQVYGLDHAWQKLKTARELDASGQAPQVQGEASALPFPGGCLRGVCLINLLHLVDHRRTALLETARVLDREGLAVIALPQETAWGEAGSSGLARQVEDWAREIFSAVHHARSNEVTARGLPERSSTTEPPAFQTILLCEKGSQKP